MNDPSPAETHPTLLVTGGPLDGSVFVVEPSTAKRLLGSSSDCDFQILLGNVEPAHAQLAEGAAGMLLSDGGSATGTYVNGERIDQDHVLHDGDRICLGPPGSKSSAKLVVRIPRTWTPAGIVRDDGGDVVIEADADPLVLVRPQGMVNPAAALQPAATAPPPSPVSLAPPPPPPPMAAPQPPLTAPPPPPPVDARRARPDYSDEPPSILGSSTGESARVPLVPPPGPGAGKDRKDASPKRALPRVSSRGAFPRVTVLGVLAVLVLGGGYWAVTNLFKSPPKAVSLVPPRTEPGRTVTISGSGFDTDPSKNTVRFGDQPGIVTSATATQLTVTVPAGLADAGPADVPVAIEGRGGKSAPLTLRVYRAPQVSGIQPDVALPGEEVTVKGLNLDGKPLTVVVGGMTAEVKAAETGILKVVVPALPLIEGRTVQVSVQIGADSAKPADLILGHLPLLSGVTPTQGAAGDRVVIKGRGFDPSPKGNVVTFGGTPALVLTASAGELAVVAPAGPLGETQATVGVVVKSGGSTSGSQATFVLTRVSAGTFVPRFFAASVPEDGGGTLAFVSTDLGPVLLFGGKDESASTAARAFQAATALNALVDEAATKAPAFEYRKDPAPAVGRAGVQAPLVTATAEDSAAYDRPWDPATKGQPRANPRMVAQHWAALLQDYFDLFVLRQRPLRVLGLSPRGKVLSDVYAEAVRTGGAGAGVPSRVVIPPSTSLTKGLRDMALLLPAEGASRAGAAIEGRWEGTMDEGGTQRQIQVKLRYAGASLAGSFSSRAGALQMDTALKDVSFDRSGAIRFAVEIAGASRLFRGSLAGAAITGTIQKSEGDKGAPGSFTLNFVE